MGTPYLASPMESLQQLENNYQIYNAALDEHSQPRPSEVAVMRTIFISDDKTLCEHTTRGLEHLASILKLGNTPMEKSWVVGNAKQVASKIQQYRERLGMNYLIVTRPRIKGLSPQCTEKSMRALAEMATTF